MYKINRWGAAFLLLAGMACWVCSPLGARAGKDAGEFRANRAVFPRGRIRQGLFRHQEGAYVPFVLQCGRGQRYAGLAGTGQRKGVRTRHFDRSGALGASPARHPGRSRYVGGAGRIRSVHREAQGNVLHGLYRVRRPLAGQANRRSGYQQRSVRLETLSGKSGLYGAGVGDAQSDRLGGLPGFAHPAIWRAVPDVFDGHYRRRQRRDRARFVGRCDFQIQKFIFVA